MELTQDMLDYLYEALPDNAGVYVFDGESARMLRASSFLRRLSAPANGEHHAESSDNILDMILPQDRAGFVEALGASLKTGRAFEYQYRIMYASGEIDWAHIHAKLCGTLDGKPVLLCVFSDTSTAADIYRELLDRSDDAVYVCDRTTYEVLYANRKARESHVGKTGALVGRMCYEYIRGKGGPCENCYIDRVMSNRSITEERENEATGRWERVSGEYIDWCGHPAFMQYIRDISAQKQSEAEYDRDISQLIATNPDTLCSFKLDLTRNICEAVHATSDYIETLLSSDTVDGLFDNIAGIIADAGDLARFRATCDRNNLIALYESGKDRVSLVYRRRMADREVHRVTTSIIMLQNPYTDTVEAVASSVDSENVIVNEEISRYLDDEVCDYVCLLYPDRGTSVLRRIASKFVAPFEIGEPLPYEEGIGWLVEHHVAPESAAEFWRMTAIANIERQIRSCGSYAIGYWSITDGARRRKNIRYGLLEDAYGPVIYIQSDVTEAYRREQEQMERLKRASEAKTEFLSRMSHDIHTPLNGIIGMTRIGRESDDVAQKDSCFEKIATSSDFLLGLANDILELTSVDTGKMTLELEPYPMEEFLGYLDAVIRPIADERGVTFDTSIATLGDRVPLMDKLKSERIVFNLLSNAFKFTPRGGKVVLSVEERALPGRRVDLTVGIADNGIGMSEEFQKTLFEPFAQENAYDGQLSGLGLGLAIVKGLVDLAGGTISVKSAPGKGTAYAIHLAVDCVPASVARNDGDALCGADEIAALKGKNVLVAEDNALNREIMLNILDKAGIVAASAEDGRQALERFRESPVGFFDGILLDIRMPVMDGLSCARALRALDRADARTVPLIAVTADAFNEQRAEALSSGMDACIAKPIVPQELYRVLLDRIGEGSAGPA